MANTGTAVHGTLPSENRAPLRIAGYVALVLGILALLSPFYAGLAATLVVAANLVVTGVLELLAAFKADKWAGTIGLLLLGFVSVVGGLFIFGNPIIGLATVTLVAIAAIFAAGIAKLFWAFKLPNGGWLALSGFLSILIAAMLFSNFPFSASWAFGVLVGVNLIVEGISLLAYVSKD